MLNTGKMVKGNCKQPNLILFDTEVFTTVPCIVKNTVTSATVDGRKIVYAGMPLAGDLTNRATALEEASADGTTKPPVGLLLNDVDVTAGDANGTLLILGSVDLGKVDSTVVAKLPTEVKAALKTIVFVK